MDTGVPVFYLSLSWLDFQLLHKRFLGHLDRSSFTASTIDLLYKNKSAVDSFKYDRLLILEILHFIRTVLVFTIRWSYSEFFFKLIIPIEKLSLSLSMILIWTWSTGCIIHFLKITHRILRICIFINLVVRLIQKWAILIDIFFLVIVIGPGNGIIRKISLN